MQTISFFHTHVCPHHLAMKHASESGCWLHLWPCDAALFATRAACRASCTARAFGHSVQLSTHDTVTPASDRACTAPATTHERFAWSMVCMEHGGYSL